jgi:hypothetical protein
MASYCYGVCGGICILASLLSIFSNVRWLALAILFAAIGEICRRYHKEFMP